MLKAEGCVDVYSAASAAGTAPSVAGPAATGSPACWFDSMGPPQLQHRTAMQTGHLAAMQTCSWLLPAPLQDCCDAAQGADHPEAWHGEQQGKSLTVLWPCLSTMHDCHVLCCAVLCRAVMLLCAQQRKLESSVSELERQNGKLNEKLTAASNKVRAAARMQRSSCEPQRARRAVNSIRQHTSGRLAGAGLVQAVHYFAATAAAAAAASPVLSCSSCAERV